MTREGAHFLLPTKYCVCILTILPENKTNSAAIYGLRGKKNLSIFILHPKGRISPVQEAQMTTVTDSNVCNIAVKGTFDECQVSSARKVNGEGQSTRLFFYFRTS